MKWYTKVSLIAGLVALFTSPLTGMWIVELYSSGLAWSSRSGGAYVTATACLIVIAYLMFLIAKGVIADRAVTPPKTKKTEKAGKYIET